MNITPGTLCLVVGYRIIADNLGKSVVARNLVKIGDTLPDGGYFGGPAEQAWACEGNDLTLLMGGRPVRNCSYAHFAPEHLLPIPPLADPISTKKEEELKV